MTFVRGKLKSLQILSRAAQGGYVCPQHAAVKRVWAAGGLIAMALAGLAAGCGREEVRVYRVPKETAQAASSEQATGQLNRTDDEQEQSLPPVKWTLPAGWQERPASSMRVGSFVVADKEGHSAEVAIVPLPGVTGRELDLVNMWRGQANLPPIAQTDLAKQAEPVAIGTEQGKLFETVSEKPQAEGKAPLRILVAMLEKDKMSWFFKMTGDDSLVREQKPVFVEFLKSITFEVVTGPVQISGRPQPVSTNVKRVPRESSAKPVWIAPSGWQEVAPGPMLTAKFVIAGRGGGKAELNISTAGGGPLANINRWRNQLGLAPVQESDLDQQVRSLDVLGGKAMLVDIVGNDGKSGQKARLLGAIVPQGSQMWFYKLMGNEEIVEREKENFVKFVQTVKYEGGLN